MRAGHPVAAALAASLLLHGAGLAALEQLPRGWLAKDGPANRFGHALLHVSLRPVTPVPAAAVSAPPFAKMAAAGRTESAGEPAKPLSPEGLLPHAYYPTHVLDERPQVRVHVEPSFPENAPVDSGRVVLSLFIGEDGRVEEVAVTESVPAGVFEQVAAQAFAAAQFTPGKMGGKPVKSLMTIEVLFGAPPAAQHLQPATDSPS
jgi:TonB family protein